MDPCYPVRRKMLKKDERGGDPCDNGGSMDLGIRGKVAIVLGASKGIGRATARALAAEGCTLALASREAGPLGDEAAAIAKAHPVQVFHRSCDVTRDADRAAFLDEVTKRFGCADILINNCGGPKTGTFKELQDPKDWMEAVERSLLQVVKWTQAVVPLMKSWGRIVNIVSTSVKQPIDGLLLSNSVRPGVIGFSKSIARELATQGITINSILPGRIRTDRTISLAESRAAKDNVSVESVLRERVHEIPAGRLGEPEEVGALAAFLSSQQAGYITGTTVTIDGGMTRTIL
jgi:3-oxoacyl-[acyl-carrier protein] reductase